MKEFIFKRMKYLNVFHIDRLNSSLLNVETFAIIKHTLNTLDHNTEIFFVDIVGIQPTMSSQIMK